MKRINSFLIKLQTGNINYVSNFADGQLSTSRMGGEAHTRQSTCSSRGRSRNGALNNTLQVSSSLGAGSSSASF